MLHLQCSHLDIILGAQQLAVRSTIQDLRSQPVNVAFDNQLRPFPVPVFDVRVLLKEDYVLPWIVSLLTDAIGNRTVVTPLDHRCCLFVELIANLLPT